MRFDRVGQVGELVVQLGLQFHHGVALGIEIGRRDDDLQGNGFARVPFAIGCREFGGHFVAGLEVQAEEVPIPGHRDTSGVFDLQRGFLPVLAVDGYVLFEPDQRQVVFGKTLE